MPLTEELCKRARTLLLSLDFQDSGDESWNIFSVRRDFGPLGELSCWGRDWTDFNFQWYQADEQFVSITDTTDLAELQRVAELTIEYLLKLNSPNASR